VGDTDGASLSGLLGLPWEDMASEDRRASKGTGEASAHPPIRRGGLRGSAVVDGDVIGKIEEIVEAG